MKPFKAIRDPKAFQLLGDDTRRKIIYLLRTKEMNVRQLASQLSLTPQAVYHHIKKLQKGGLVEITREERCGHLIESYYRATAELFSLSLGKTTAKSLQNKQILKEQTTTALNALTKLGFDLKYDEEKIKKLVNVKSELEECCTDISKLQEELYKLEELDLFTKKTVESYVKTLSITDEEFKKKHENRKKFRELLVSLIKKNKTTK